MAARLYFTAVLAFALGCVFTGLSATRNYTIVRLNATEELKDLISPNFPSNYPIYEKIMYILTASDSHSGIAIKFKYFQMETSANCLTDSLKLYKANYEFNFLVKTYCGHKKPSNIFISENNVTLVFTTNAHLEKRGFRLQYYATRTNPYSKPESNTDSGFASGIPAGVVIGFAICAFLVVLMGMRKKKAEEAKKVAEQKKKAEAKKKADEKKQADEKNKADEKQKAEAEETKNENQIPKCGKSPNMETVGKPVNQSTQTFTQPLPPINQQAFGLSQPLIPIGQPAQPITQPLPPRNESVPSMSQHFQPYALQSQVQPLFHPMLYPPIQGELSRPIHLVQPVSNTSSTTRQLVGTEAFGGTRSHGLAEPPSYEALSFDYNIPATQLL